MTLSDLLGRVEGAGTADRELDVDIAWALEPDRYRAAYWNGRVGKPGTTLPLKLDGLGRVSVKSNCPSFTGSIDAALALVERKLPGWVVEHIGADAVGVPMQMKTIGWTVELGFGSPLVMATEQGRAPTLPVAICAALLRALIQLETQGTE